MKSTSTLEIACDGGCKAPIGKRCEPEHRTSGDDAKPHAARAKQTNLKRKVNA